MGLEYLTYEPTEAIQCCERELERRKFDGAWDYLKRDILGILPYNDPPEKEIRGFVLERDRERYRKSIKATVDEHSLEIYKLYREKVVHEDTLINFRTSWHVAMQAFLFGGLALAYSRLEGPEVTFAILLAGAAGISASITTLVSVMAADAAINKTTAKWKAPHRDNEDRELRIGVRDIVDPAGILPAIKGAGSDTGIARRGKYSSQLLPGIIALLWFMLFSVTAYNASGVRWTSSGIVFDGSQVVEKTTDD